MVARRRPTFGAQRRVNGFAYLVVVVLTSVGCGVAVEATGSPAATVQITVLPLPHSGKTIRVPPGGPCPQSLRGYGNVSNPEGELEHVLLPPKPLFGVICWYGSSASTTYGLTHTSLVNGRTARALGVAIDELSTRPPRGAVACPAAFNDAAIITLRLASGAAVDLWYDDSGCQTLDNGYVRAYEIGQRAFFETFIPLVTGLRPAPRDRGTP